MPDLDNNNGEEVEDIEISDGEIGLTGIIGENIWAGDERNEPNDLAEDDNDSEDDEDTNEAELEEEFDYRR